MKWWEKTVEYFFIRKYVPEEAILSPLDGKQEAAGDSILGNDEKWLLIEFKVDNAALASEKSKYISYETTKRKLVDNDTHHFLVYGTNDGGCFDVRACTYFSNRRLPDVGNIFKYGKSQVQFIEYLEEVIKGKKTSGSSSGGVSGSLAFVAAVNGENKLTRCMSLKEFGLEFSLTLKPELTHTQKLQQKRSRGIGFGR